MSCEVVCAILAAGNATRLGRPKASLEYDGATFLERALAAASGRRTAVVTGVRASWMEKTAARFGAFLVTNDAPQRGMTHSLRIADAALGCPQAALAVLLVDTPLVDADIVARIALASTSADIAFPMHRSGRPGHPVFFGPRARLALAALADGDTLRTLRDDPRFTIAPVAFDDERPFTDVDTAADFDRLTA